MITDRQQKCDGRHVQAAYEKYRRIVAGHR